MHTGRIDEPAVLGSAFLFAFVLAAGCGREEIQVYSVPKEAPQIAQPATPSHEGGRPHAHWSAPSDWKEQPGSGIRLATFVIPGPEGRQAELSVIPLPGVTDIKLESLNIWRRELGLPPLTEAELPTVSSPVTVGSASGELFEFVGTNAPPAEVQPATLGAIATAEGATWFFKMTGPASIVMSQKEPFQKFLASVEMHGAGAHGSPVASASPAPPTLAPPSQRPDVPDWQPPAHWQEQPATSMRLATFQITGSEGDAADLSVTKFPGTAGGLVANVNRWRQQIGLAPLNPAELEQALAPLDAQGAEGKLVDMTSTDQNTRVIAAIVPREDFTWFYKLTGSPSLLEKEKAAFVKFVESARYQ